MTHTYTHSLLFVLVHKDKVKHERPRKGPTHTWIHSYAHMRSADTHAANQTLLPLLTHTRRSLLLFFLRFLLPTWDWLAIRRCIYHICQLLCPCRSSSLLSTHLLLVERSVKSQIWKSFIPMWDMPIWKILHIVILSGRWRESGTGYWLAVFFSQPGSIQ